MQGVRRAHPPKISGPMPRSRIGTLSQSRYKRARDDLRKRKNTELEIWERKLDQTAKNILRKNEGEVLRLLRKQEKKEGIGSEGLDVTMIPKKGRKAMDRIPDKGGGGGGGKKLPYLWLV